MSKNNTKKFDPSFSLALNKNNKLARPDKSVITTKEVFQHGPDRQIPFTLVQSKRRKTSELIIENDYEITLRVPYGKPIEEIKEIIQKKIQWILAKQDQYRKSTSEIQEHSYLPLSTLPYLGHNYVIEFNIVKDQKGFENDTLEFQKENGKFLFTLFNGNDKDSIENKKDKIKMLYQKWLYGQAETIFKNKIDEFSRIVHVEPQKIVLKRLRNRWGSITKNSTINLNVNLIKAPDDVIDYIIIHELCHFKIKGHSFRFWNYLKQFVPDYDKKVRWLEQNSKTIL